jgi:hypothetical protein
MQPKSLAALRFIQRTRIGGGMSVRGILGCFVLCASLLIFCAAAAPQAGNQFTTIDVPRGESTEIMGINSAGEIVGTFHSRDSGRGRIFLLSQGKYVTLELPPGGGDSIPVGISDRGVIVIRQALGGLGSGSDVHIIAYTRVREGPLTLVTLPPGYNEKQSDLILAGLGSSSDFVGTTWRGSAELEVFRVKDGKVHVLGNIPEGARVYAANAAGVVIGDLVVKTGNAKGSLTGFVLRDGKVSTFAYPGADSTTPRAINERGEIVGSFHEANGTSKEGCFRLDANGKLFELVIPETRSCAAMGINNDGAIVGTFYGKDPGFHGFLWQPSTGNALLRAVADKPADEPTPAAKSERAPQPSAAPKQEAAPPNPVAAPAQPVKTSPAGQPTTPAPSSVARTPASTPTVAPAPTMPAMLMRISAGTDLVKIAVPGALATEPAGMNSRGDVVGSYEDGQHERGFLFRQGKYILLDFPGAESTFPVAINDIGTVAGIYDGKSGLHSFIRSAAGVFRTVSFHDENGKPNSMISILGMTNSGAVWASKVKTDDHPVYLLDPTGQRVLYRFKAGSQLNGMNSNGTMTGEMLSEDGPSGSSVGFIIRSGNLSTIRYPGANKTYAEGINDHEDVVGTFVDANNNAGCFRRNMNGEMAELIIPGAYLCRARQINNAGDVAGDYTLKGSEAVGFRWRPRKGELVQLAVAPSQPVRASPSGQPTTPAPSPVVRTPPPVPSAAPVSSTHYSRVSTTERRGSLMSPASGSYSPLQDSLHSQIQPYGLNSAGEVVGYSPDHGEGFIWRQGRFEFFRNGVDQITTANGISDAGIVAGKTGSVSNSGYETFFVFIRSRDGSVRRVPLPNGMKGKLNVTCVNSAGQVFAKVTGDDYVERFIRVNPGPSAQVDVLDTFDSFQCANSSGVGVGYGAFPHSGPESGPSGYTVENGATTYFTVPNSTSTRAMSINDRGDVVGDYVDENRTRRCFLRHSSGDFAELKIGESTDCYAAAINNDGEVVGTYKLKEGVFPIGFIWYPSGFVQTASGVAPLPPGSGQTSSGGASRSTETPIEEAELDSMIGLAQKYSDISSIMRSLNSRNFDQALQVLDQSNAAIRRSLSSADPALNRAELRAALSALLWIRAHTYSKLGRQDLMINALTEATQITPSARTFTDLCRAQSLATTMGGDYLSLLPPCTRAIELNPEGADPYFHRGAARAISDAVLGANAQGLLKLSDSAESDLRRYLDLAPEGIHAAEARDALSKAGKH